SAICSVTRGVSICASSPARTSTRRCGSTSPPSRTWPAWPPRACTTTSKWSCKATKTRNRSTTSVSWLSPRITVFGRRLADPADELIIYGPDLAEVARHRLLPAHTQGQRSVQPEHQPQINEHLRRATLEERFAELGAAGPRFLAGLVQTRRCSWDQAQRVLELLTVYRRTD